MKIRMKGGLPLAGPDVSHLGRGVYDLPDAQALAVVAEGHGEAVDPAPPPPPAETADAPASGAETAALKSKGKRG